MKSSRITKRKKPWSRWTPLRDKQLRELHAAGCPSAKIAEIMRISKNAVHIRLGRLGLSTPIRHWTAEEDAVLISIGRDMKKCQAATDRLPAAIYGRWRYLGMSRPENEAPGKQVDAIRQLWVEGLTVPAIARKLGLKESSIHEVIARKRKADPSAFHRRRREWAPSEIQRLESMTANGASIAEMAKLFQRPISSVAARVRMYRARLGIKAKIGRPRR